MKLCDLKRGEYGKIIKIGEIGELKQRLIVMGVTNGTKIKFERSAPLGDPQEYIIKSTGISIRKEDAENIEIQKIVK